MRSACSSSSTSSNCFVPPNITFSARSCYKQFANDETPSDSSGTSRPSQLIDIPAHACVRVAVRLEAQDLVAHNATAIEVERRRQIAEPHRALHLDARRPRDRERELHLVEVPLQALRVVVDRHQQE